MPGSVRHLLGAASDVAYLECDRERHILFASSAAERLFASSKLVGSILDAFYVPNDLRDDKPRHDSNAALAGELLEEDGWRVRADGTVFPACVRMASIGPELIGIALTQKKLLPNEVTIGDAFGFFLENAPVAVIACDETGRITHCNPMAAALTGRSRDAVVGMNVGDPAFADDLEAVRRDFSGLVTSGVMEAEYRVKRIDGPPFWLRVRGVRLKEGVYIAFLADITPRKSSEQMLHAGEDRLYLALTASGLGIWNWEARPGRVLLSRRCYQILGIETFAGSLDALRSLIHADDRAEFGLHLERSLQERIAMRTEVRVIRPTGDVRWVSVTAQGDYDTAGRPVRLMGTIEDVTEKAALRHDAEHAQRRYHALIAASSFSVWSADAAGKTYRVEGGGGTEPSETRGITLENIHPDDRPSVMSAMRQAMETQGDFAAEMRMLMPDGSWRYQLSRAVALFDDAGRLQEWIGITIDSHPWRSAEAKLRESEEQLRLLVDGLADHAVYLLDAEGGIITWNAAAQRIDGFSAEEIVGKPFASLWPPDEIARGKPACHLKTAADQGSVAFEGWRQRKDGSRFWAIGTISAIGGGANGVRGYVTVTRDMTPQRHAEQLVQSILDNTLDGIITVDEQGRILAFNRAAEIIFGHSAADVIGADVTLLVPEPHRAHYAEHVSDYLRSGTANIIGANREVEAQRRDGSIIPVDLAVTEFFLDERRHFIGIVRDISQRKALESQLRQSQKMEAIGLLAGGVAHDFNNLLTVIAGYGQTLLQETPREDPKRNAVAAIIDAQERAAGLTRQLLAFSRQSVLEPRVLDLNLVVSDTERLLRRIIGEDIVFTTALDLAIRPVKVDPAQLSQVLLNLAVNARDAMPKGGELRLSTTNVAVRKGNSITPIGLAPGDYVLLEVTDTGHGMTPEVRARIFEPFFTTKPVGKGTGLGLATVYGIIRASGGHIEVASEWGRGTTFRIYFPASDEVVAPAPAEAPSPQTPRGNETILLVEDETSVRNLIKIVLEKNGYRVLDAGDGLEALRVFEEAGGKIDILVTDIVMPHRNGPELAVLLRERLPLLRVLFTSGYTEDAVVRHGLEQDPTSFLQKPYAPSDLLRKIRQSLDRTI